MAEINNVGVPKSATEVWIRVPNTPKTESHPWFQIKTNQGIVFILFITFLVLLAINREKFWIDGSPWGVGAIDSLPIFGSTTIPGLDWSVTTAKPGPDYPGPVGPAYPGPAYPAYPGGDFRRVIAYALKMRKKPCGFSDVIEVLPEGTVVKVVGQTHRDANGTIWLRVCADGFGPDRAGWVDERYVR